MLALMLGILAKQCSTNLAAKLLAYSSFSNFQAFILAPSPATGKVGTYKM